MYTKTQRCNICQWLTYICISVGIEQKIIIVCPRVCFVGLVKSVKIPVPARRGQAWTRAMNLLRLARAWLRILLGNIQYCIVYLSICGSRFLMFIIHKNDVYYIYIHMYIYNHIDIYIYISKFTYSFTHTHTYIYIYYNSTLPVRTAFLPHCSRTFCGIQCSFLRTVP